MTDTDAPDVSTLLIYLCIFNHFIWIFYVLDFWRVSSEESTVFLEIV